MLVFRVSFSDGAGKSTQINLLKKHIDQHNIRVEKQLFNYNSEEKRRFLIENPISSGGEGLTLHISTTGSSSAGKKRLTVVISSKCLQLGKCSTPFL